jgi:hypothetical protein
MAENQLNGTKMDFLKNLFENPSFRIKLFPTFNHQEKSNPLSLFGQPFLQDNKIKHTAE